MFDANTLTALKELAASGTEHIALPRQLYVDLVKTSGTKDEGDLKAAKHLENAVDIREVAPESKRVAAMLDMLQKVS